MLPLGPRFALSIGSFCWQERNQQSPCRSRSRNILLRCGRAWSGCGASQAADQIYALHAFIYKTSSRLGFGEHLELGIALSWSEIRSIVLTIQAKFRVIQRHGASCLS
jgi:hypothetical protein